MSYFDTFLPFFKQHTGKFLLSGACLVMLFLAACGDSDEDVAFRKAICALAAESRDVFVLGGSDGESFYSADGGLSFERGNSNTTSDLTDSEYNLGVVWSVGKGGYLGSQLSLGADYTLSDSGTTEDLYNLKWVTPTIGLAVGDNGVVSRSTDAGITWTSQTIGDSHLRGVDCSSATNCWVVGTGMGLYWSGDAGETFMRLNPDLGLDSTIDFHGVSTPSEGAAWIVGSVGTVFKTTDFGISYSYIDSGTSNSLNDIYVDESGNG
ncbi:MAG: hypothetical protein KDD70_18835, partial [Bdellovibrionales bacterium]|nr:hypothetical protein [Bdellovibrionales bacterium]